MARRYDDGDFAGGLIGGVVVAAVLLAVGIGILLWAMVTELWTIYKTRAFTGTRSARILWIALAALIAAFLVSGLLATQPDTAPIGLFTACWSLFIYVIVCIAVDKREQERDVPVVVMPAELSLGDVASWNNPSAATPALPRGSDRSTTA